MSEPERRPHTEEPAEGQDADESGGSGRTPHAEQPAEGEDVGDGGTDTPS